MNREVLFSQMKNAIIVGDKEKALELAELSLKIGIDPSESIDDGYVPGIQEVGNLWEKGEYFLPELILGAEAMKAALDIFNPILSKRKEKIHSLGKVIIGTVEGDIHDIGKTLVASMFTANGFDVIDLGADVKLNLFVEKAEEEKADMICMSALLTTTMIGQRKVIEILKQKGLREKYKVMVGGAPVTKEWALSIGADGTADNAALAVKIAKSFFE
ncbi:MAG: corrinoid protein [Acidobacteriota bacterium]